MAPETISTISAFSNLTMAIVAMVALILAILGYGGWKRQLSAKDKHELARRLLKATYRLREAINFVRNPFISISEMPTPPKNHPLASDDERKKFYGIAKAYEKRWEQIMEAKADLSSELLEAEILLGEEVKNKYNMLFEVERKLYIALRRYLDSIDPDKRYDYKKEENIEDIIYFQGDEDKDEYLKELKNTIKDIEKFLKPHLLVKKPNPRN